jgi:hypothetical protein
MHGDDVAFYEPILMSPILICQVCTLAMGASRPSAAAKRLGTYV